MNQELPERLAEVKTELNKDEPARQQSELPFQKFFKKSEYEVLDGLRNQLTYQSTKKVLTERTLDEIQESLNEIGDSVLQMNKLQSYKGYSKTFEQIIAEAEKSVVELQKEIETYKSKVELKCELNSSMSPSKTPDIMSSEIMAGDQVVTSSPRSHSSAVSGKIKSGGGTGLSKMEELDRELNDCQRRNKTVLVEEWQFRESYYDKLKELESLKSAISSSPDLTSDPVFAGLFKEWLELRASESFFKAEKFLLDQEMKSLERNNAINLMESQKSADVVAEIENLELEAIENQQKLQSLFTEVYQSNGSIQKIQQENVDLINNSLLPSLEIAEDFSNLPDRIKNDTACLKTELLDQSSIDIVCNALKNPGDERTNFEFRKEMKRVLGLSSAVRDDQILTAVEKKIALKESLDRQKLSLHKSVKSSAETENAMKDFPHLCEDIVMKNEKQLTKFKTSEARGKCAKHLQEIEKKLAEIEDECGQFVVPWMKVDGYSLRQYRQMVKERFEHK